MKTNWKTEWKPLVLIAGLFLACFYLPVGVPRFDNAVKESFELVKWYAREHVILCLVPAFFIAGAIGVFVSQASVMKYLGPKANKLLAYGVASVSGTILAVCSCTVLPLFAGIWRMGAGLGPATAFLYSGPAINVLAIVLTARVLGLELGIARAVGAIVFSVVGLSVLTSTSEGETGEWFASTWSFAKQITPLLLFGVLAAGFFLGRPGHEGIIPSEWVTQAVGGNSLRANLLASVVGALMYFATLTEVPILQGLLGNGMGQGPALALLLAGPSLSLQSLLVLRTVMGTKKMLVYRALVVGMATMTGLIYGAIH